MRSAHRLARRFTLDPFYSDRDPVPAVPTHSLFSPPSQGACWLYEWGGCEAYLLARLRLEAHRDCLDVFHPSLFRKPSSLLWLYRTFTLRAARKAEAALYHSGNLHLVVNGRVALHVEGASRPVKQRLDLAPFLKKGGNEISAVLNRVDGPPALFLDSPVLRTDAAWEASSDGFHRRSPACRPFVTAGRFPHEERMPVLTRRPRSFRGGLYDFGVELLGRPKVCFAGAGGRVSVFPGESEEEARNTSPRDFEQRPGRSLRGARSLTGPLMAFRYLRVEAASGARVRDVACEAEVFPARYRGAFACSDERLNAVWMRAAYTLRLCMREFFVDGIKRDRMPWAGDLYLAVLCNAFSFGEDAVARRTLTALAGEDPSACHANGIIDYTLFRLLALEAYHAHSGDGDYARNMLPEVERVLAALAESEDAEGFLMPRPDDRLFLDWAEMEKKGRVAALQMLYAMALQASERLFAAFGDAPRAAALKRRRQGLARRSSELFWDGRRGGFVEHRERGRRKSPIGRHANFLALLSGTATLSQRRRILSRVLQNPDIPAVGTPYMRFFELLALARCGRVPAMLEGIRNYWGGMLDEGATTFWEAYDPAQKGAEHLAFYGRPFGRSLCHAWAAGPVYLLSSALTGLEPLEAGWRRFRVRPGASGLDWACATVPTPLGEIRLELDGRSLTVKIPKGAILEERLPGGGIRPHGGGRVARIRLC
ncbi:MAG: alpha-L-rhamnosidase C-terminal domain-containing protein [Planctomycetota bacterium]